MHVLLLEDDANVAESLTRAFGLRGWEYTWAKDLKEARALIAVPPAPYTCALLDLNLPDGKGTDLVLEWGPDEAPLYARLPCAIYSGLPEDAKRILTGMELEVPGDVRVFSKGDPFEMLDWLEEQAASF